jgi:hypothetical protein
VSFQQASLTSHTESATRDSPVELESAQALAVARLCSVMGVSKAPQMDNCRALGGAGGELKSYTACVCEPQTSPGLSLLRTRI